MVTQAFAKRVTKSKRFNEVMHIMLEHRLPSLLQDIGALQRQAQVREKTPKPEVAVDGRGPASAPVRVRRLMEDLGPTFIKIGQLLGTRPDLIPKEYIEEFKKMYDQTVATPFDEIKFLIEEELGKPLHEVFKDFEEKPIASASIAQVHRAVLRSGQTVAVKVQHPGIEGRMHTDFEILRGIVTFTERFFAASQVWQPVKHLEEISHMLNKELDFRNELRTSILMEENFADVAEVKIPHPHADLSTKRVLVMEFIAGTKFYDRHKLKLTPRDNQNLARIITHAMAKQIFLDRLFHADPSPGNVLLMGPNQVCFLDFGAVGQVTKRRSRTILEFIEAMNQGNLDETARVIVELCEVRREYDQKQFLYDLERIIEYLEAERATIADPALLDKIIQLANTHGMLLPPDFMLITRAVYQFDGMCEELDDEYELMTVLMPFVQKTIKERFLSPQLQSEALTAAAQDLGKFLTRLPTHLERILMRMEKGQLTTRHEITGLEDFKRHQAAVSYFTSFTLLLGFCALGTATAFAFGGLAAFQVAGFVSLLAVLIWLVAMLAFRQGLEKRRW